MTRVVYPQSTDTGYGNQAALTAVKANLWRQQPHNNNAHYLYHGDNGIIQALISTLGTGTLIEKEM